MVRSLLVSVVVLGCMLRLPAQSCPPTDGSTEIIYTDTYSLSVGSAEGAVGDVVAVPVVLQSNLVTHGFVSIVLTVCHDPQVAEMVGAPAYTEEFLSILSSGGVVVWTVNDEDSTAEIPQVGHGAIIYANLNKEAYEARFPSDIPLPMMTLYYRIRGNVGSVGAFRFCDGELERGRSYCNYNFIVSISPAGDSAEYVSTEKTGGTLTVLPGPATHPDVPPQPPEATVYPVLPGPEETNFRVRVEGATALPGTTEVPIEVYCKADVEYTGIVLPLDFDERYLRLARAEDHFLAGAVLIKNGDGTLGSGSEEGNAVILGGFLNGRLRVAAEGEEIHAATLYFDILEAASEVESTTITVGPVTDVHGILQNPWVGVRHKGGLNGESVIRSEIAPIEIVNGILALRSALFLRGDSNLDGKVDLSDAQATLSYLFLSAESPRCLDAADADDNGGVNIADPIATLQHLFQGGPAIPEPSEAPGTDPTLDELGCHG
jgi:hypothetical protein